MRVDLASEVALVVGAGSGTGRAVALALAESGARVVLLDADSTAIDATAREIGLASGACSAVAANLADTHQLREVVSGILDHHGRLDILVNVTPPAPSPAVLLHQLPPTEWQTHLATELDVVFAASQAAIPALLSTGGGRIVNVTSVLGVVPLRGHTLAGTTAAGVLQLTRSMAAELGAQGLRVNAVAAGVSLTSEAPEFGPHLPLEQADVVRAHTPLARTGSPEDLAAAVLFLVSPASGAITGAVLPVDGGWLVSFHRDW